MLNVRVSVLPGQFQCQKSVIHERFQRELETRMGIFEKLIKRMAQYYYAKERDGIGWRWQKRDGFQEELRRPFGRRENRQESNR
ncbi:MAG: hypothetical protein LC674_05830 [Actinobacteria bacterium]|nr:hypothetical protein [Actinomycetota bacterium]